MVKVEIKRDGKKAAIDFAPIAELNISEALHRHGITMQHVADKLGITRAAVQQMITGSPNVSTIYKIAWLRPKIFILQNVGRRQDYRRTKGQF